jgi:hypothetical protein
MSKALYITAAFRNRSLENYGVVVLSGIDACAMIRRAEQEGVRVLGIDSFLIRSGTIQPFMEHSVDYSSRGHYSESDWDAAVAFIESKIPLGFAFEVVLGDAITVDDLPNQLRSPDPTLSSGTSTAGQQARDPKRGSFQR